jgi:hypothetical protein
VNDRYDKNECVRRDLFEGRMLNHARNKIECL